MAINRYAIRIEDNGTWTVFDTDPPSRGENRMMIGLSEARAKAFADRLNDRPPRPGQTNEVRSSEFLPTFPFKLPVEEPGHQ